MNSFTGTFQLFSKIYTNIYMENSSPRLLLKELVIEVLRVIEVAIERCSSYLALHIFGFATIPEEKYYYLTKHYCPKDQNWLFKKQCIKVGKTKNLTCQLSWIQKKPWHVYCRELQAGLCKKSVLFNQNLGSKPQSKFVKTVFQDVGKSKK